jgi:hypothetical protein
MSRVFLIRADGKIAGVTAISEWCDSPGRVEVIMAYPWKQPIRSLGQVSSRIGASVRMPAATNGLSFPGIGK